MESKDTQTMKSHKNLRDNLNIFSTKGITLKQQKNLNMKSMNKINQLLIIFKKETKQSRVVISMFPLLKDKSFKKMTIIIFSKMKRSNKVTEVYLLEQMDFKNLKNQVFRFIHNINCQRAMSLKLQRS